MLRFIIKSVRVDDVQPGMRESYFTIDVDVPKLENVLIDGGSAGSSYERNELIGVEVIDKPMDLA